MPKHVTTFVCLIIAQILALNFVPVAEASHATRARVHACGQEKNLKWKERKSFAYLHFAVSYTHLTLPTKA